MLIATQYDAILNFYRSSTNADERNTSLRCLGRANNPELIKSTLDMMFGGEVKNQDMYMPSAGLRSHPEGIEALFQWLTENWEELKKRHPPELSMLGSMVTIMTSSFTKPEQLARVEKFFADKDTNGFNQSLNQSLDAIRSKVAWLDRDREDVAAWVKSSGY